MDPVYAAVSKELLYTDHDLLDVGCGLGLLAFWLREQGFRPSIVGCELESTKVAEAQRIAGQYYPQTTFLTHDAASGLPSHKGHVCLLDMLQYLTAEQQEKVLHEAVARVPQGACLLIRTGLTADHWRYRLGRAVDQFARKIGWIKSPPITYPTRERLIAILRDAGMDGDLQPLWGRTPFHNYFGKFTRRADA